jgi:hypothetical protein
MGAAQQPLQTAFAAAVCLFVGRAFNQQMCQKKRYEHSIATRGCQLPISRPTLVFQLALSATSGDFTAFLRAIVRYRL